MLKTQVIVDDLSANHLGNVLTVFSDRKLGIDNNGDADAGKYITYVENATDYYPFGLEMPGRKKAADTHRYGFNGKEKDRSFSSSNHYDYGFRIYIDYRIIIYWVCSSTG